MLPVDKIKKSFKCCDISIATDGTEDSDIFNYDLLKDNAENEFNEKEYLFEDNDNVYDNDIM